MNCFVVVCFALFVLCSAQDALKDDLCNKDGGNKFSLTATLPCAVTCQHNTFGFWNKAVSLDDHKCTVPIAGTEGRCRMYGCWPKDVCESLDQLKSSGNALVRALFQSAENIASAFAHSSEKMFSGAVETIRGIISDLINRFSPKQQ